MINFDKIEKDTKLYVVKQVNGSTSVPNVEEYVFSFIMGIETNHPYVVLKSWKKDNKICVAYYGGDGERYFPYSSTAQSSYFIYDNMEDANKKRKEIIENAIHTLSRKAWEFDKKAKELMELWKTL